MSADTSVLQDAVLNSSPDFIQNSLISIKQQRFPEMRWLRKGNRYAKETCQKLFNEEKRRIAPIRPNELAEYIAISTILHISDGWSFFSTAIESLINGEIPTSVFMAYYAQLRAVMSFFACASIGIFNTKHYWFDIQGNCKFFVERDGTHGCVRNLMTSWANEPIKSKGLLDLFKLENKSFTLWLEDAQFTLGRPVINLLASDWLKTWSLDLDVINRDHIIRNEASYRPQRIISSKHDYNFDSTLSMLLNFWKASEPLGAHRFSELDRHLLRLSISRIFKTLTGKNPYTHTKYSELIKTMMINTGVEPNGYLFDFMTFRVDQETHPIFLWANKPGIQDDGTINPLSVLSRSFLLLRLASAAIQDLLNFTHITKQDLMFWWNPLGIDQGYWMPDNLPQNMTDLWLDAELDIRSIEGWYGNNPMPQPISCRQEMSLELKQLTRFGKVCFWGIGL